MNYWSEIKENIADGGKVIIPFLFWMMLTLGPLFLLIFTTASK
jgi:lipid-A-disaccharide synthase-like uncharacterized protein|tara:strand:- start:8653 stop:8781 length:129 start_codon:yes stop_codon:yes gene_type:complete